VCNECLIENRKKIGASQSKINNQLIKRYGITLEEYNSLLVSQDFCCAICRKHVSTLKVRLHVDHCHTTLKVRGLLCFNCNNALGRFKDNPEILQNAIDYITR
jgi:phage gp36-like protein